MRHDYPPEEIRIDEQLVLRRLQLRSASTIFHAIDEDREHLRPWLPFVDHTRKKEDTEIFIKSVLHSSCQKKDLIYEIWSGSRFAGLIALKEIDGWNKKSEIGYWIIKSCERQGIITRSCEELIELSFTKLGLNRLQLKAAVGNARSCLVAERLNFTREGIEREGEQHHHKSFDLIVYSLLKKEWKPVNAPRPAMGQ